MDLATLIGLIGAFGIVLSSIILGGSAGTFINTPSLLVVLGGTVMVTMMKFSLYLVISALLASALNVLSFAKETWWHATVATNSRLF